jgi:hypothetical protein
VFRALSAQAHGGVLGARARVLPARFDLEEAAAALDRDAEIWDQLVRVRRHISRAAYEALAAETPPQLPSLRRYRVVAGEAPTAFGRARAVRGRRPSGTPNALG